MRIRDKWQVTFLDQPSDKCIFMLPEVGFLGRIVGADGMRPSKSKTEYRVRSSEAAVGSA